MHKRIATLLIVVFVIACLFLAPLSISAIDNPTGADLQAMIDAFVRTGAWRSAGWTIKLPEPYYDCRYTGKITITKPIYLVGYPTVLDFQGVEGVCFNVNTSAFDPILSGGLEKIGIVGSKAEDSVGIQIEQSQNYVIRDCSIRSFEVGVRYINSHLGKILDSDIRATIKACIEALDDSNGGVVKNSWLITRDGYGAILADSNGWVFEADWFEHARGTDGIAFVELRHSADNNSFLACKFDANGELIASIIIDRNCRGNTVKYNALAIGSEGAVVCDDWLQNNISENWIRIKGEFILYPLEMLSAVN